MCQHMTGELHLHRGESAVMWIKWLVKFFPVRQGQLFVWSKNLLFFKTFGKSDLIIVKMCYCLCFLLICFRLKLWQIKKVGGLSDCEVLRRILGYFLMSACIVDRESFMEISAWTVICALKIVGDVRPLALWLWVEGRGYGGASVKVSA